MARFPRLTSFRGVLLGVLVWGVLGLSPSLSAYLVITEIHYAPVDSSGLARDELEFVEIFNDGPEPHDLLGYRFVEGIFYEFDRYIIPPRSYVVVCRDVAAVTSTYGIANAVGNFQGALDNDGEDLALANEQGAVVSKVDYNDSGKWPTGARGTGHSLSIWYEYTDPGEPENWRLSQQMGGSPGLQNFASGVTFVDSPLIAVGETWRYFKGTQEPSNPTTAWRQIGFNDNSWLSGPTGIGYGDGDDATFLDDMENGPYVTVFCRKTFTLTNVDEIDSLVFSVGYDDGFFAYLNGTEVASRNVGGRAFDDTATGTVNDADFEDIDLSAFKNRLVEGTNVFAIQVHNVSNGSSDLSMLPALVSRRAVLPGEVETLPIVVNEGYLRTGDERFVEFYNTSSSTVNLGGYWISDSFSDLQRYEIPANTLVPGRGFVSFTESELGMDLSIVPVSKERVFLALTNPAGTRVVDAYIFRPDVDGKSEARVPDGAARFQPAADATPGAANRMTVASDIVINEIMYHPLSNDDRMEYVELFNRGGGPVDISSWTLDGVGNLVMPPGTVMAAGDYLVVCGSPSTVRQVYKLDFSVVLDTAWDGSLRDGGERLRLKNAFGNTVDEVRYYDGGYWSAWADGGGSSLELIDPFSDNGAPGAWDASDDSADSTARTYSYANVPYGGGESDFQMALSDGGIVIVDNVSLTRSGQSTNLIANGSFDSSTSGWRIEGTHSRSGRTSDPSERIQGNGSLKLICRGGGGDYKVNRVETGTQSQTNGTYTVSYRARWIVGSNRVLTFGDYTTGRADVAPLAGSNAIAVPLELGTPGEQNSVTVRQMARTGSPNIGPAIGEVSHSPGVPENAETVTVTARVRDADAVGSVQIRYRTESPEGGFSTRPMTDPDGDGVFTGTIPGQSLGTRVVFYLEATDGGARTSRFPPDIFARTHPPILNPGSPAANDHLYLLYRHDTRNVNTSQHSLRFILTETSENYLYNRVALSNEMLEGAMVFGSGDVYQNSKIRFAGSPWLRGGSRDWNKSYSIKSAKDNILHQRLFAFNLDERGSDGRERLAHYLLRHNASATRLPYFDFMALTRFQLNDVHTQRKELLQKPNTDFLSFWFPDEDLGSLFEMDDRFEFNDGGSKEGNREAHVQYPPYGSTAGGSNKENYRWYFNPRGGNNKTKDDYSGLIQLARTMDEQMTSDSSFDNQVWSVIDVEELLRVWAIDLNIDNWDTWAGNRGKNGYLHRSSLDRLWRKIPFDLELSFGNVNAFGMPGSISQRYNNHFSEITRMINRPRIKRMYYGILAEAVDQATGFFQSSFLRTYTQQLGAAGVGSLGAANSGGFIDQRADRIRGWIRSAVFPQQRLRISTNGGNDFVADDPTVDLAGSAPADIFYLVVTRNGGPVDDEDLTTEFSTSNFTGWTMENILLGGGVNTLQVLGFNSRGRIIDTDSIRVTSPVDWEQPAVTAIAPPQAGPEDMIVITGTDFHDGLDVVFGGAVESTDVAFDEGADPDHITAMVPDLFEGVTTIQVRNIDGQLSEPLLFTVLPPAARFLRGDANFDTVLEVSDGLKILLYLFQDITVGCRDALDANDDGTVNLTDSTVILNYIFLQGPPPASPFPGVGSDPTDGDPLDCEAGEQ